MRETKNMLRNKIVYFKVIYKFACDQFFIEVIKKNPICFYGLNFCFQILLRLLSWDEKIMQC